MNKSKITISDIARYMGISTSTVSRALNNNPTISEETRKKVQATAQQLNYKPNHSAIALKGGKSRLIGLLLPSLDHPFYRKINQAVEKYAQEQGYRSILIASFEDYEKEKIALDTFEQLGIDGLIACPSIQTQDFGHFESFNDIRPVVFADRRAPLSNCSMVLTNDRQAAYDATRYFIDQQKPRIAFLGSNLSLPHHLERKTGFLNACKDMNILPPEDWIISTNLNPPQLVESLDQIISNSPAPQALICSNTIAVLSLVNYCKKYGLQIPADLGVISFGDHHFSALMNPSLSTIDRRGEEVGKLAIEILFANLLNDREVTPEYRVIRPRIIHRNSSSFRQKLGTSLKGLVQDS